MRSNTVARVFMLAAAFALIFSAGDCRAGDLWVDMKGSDSAAGDAANPWRTLQHAVDYAGPGDVVWVRQGTYAGFRAEKSGLEDAWISITAAPGAEVVISRPGSANRHQSNLEFETWEGDGVVAYWQVQGLTILNAPRYGIDVRGDADSASHHFVISGNQVKNSGRTGIFFAFTNDVVVAGNESHRNGEHGVYLSNSGDRHQVLNNRLHDNYACGLHMNGDLSMGGDGVISGALIQGNDLWMNGSGGGAAINLDGVVDSKIFENRVVDNLAGGVALFQGDGAVASRVSEIRGNTIIMPETGRWAVNLTDYGCSDVTLSENYIESGHAWRGSIRLPGPSLAGFYSDYNELTGRFSVNGGDSVISLAAWQAYGFDPHSTLLP